MEGGTPLRTWEKLYWGLFVGGLAFLLYSRLFLAETKKPDPKASTFCTFLSSVPVWTAKKPRNMLASAGERRTSK